MTRRPHGHGWTKVSRRKRRCIPSRREGLGIVLALPAAQQKPKNISTAAEQKPKNISTAISYLKEVKETLKDNGEKFYEFAKVMKDFKGGRISVSELSEKIKDLFKGQPELILGFNTFLTKEQKGKNSLKELIERVAELDILDNDEDCTPSYRRLPKNHAFPSVRYRDKLDASVLNDEFVCVAPPVNEGESSEDATKTEYEQMLFLWEDERYELDMRLEPLKSAEKHVKLLLENLGTNNEDNLSFVKFFFEDRHRKCIQQLYPDSDLHVIEMIKEDVHTSLVGILSKLKQAQNELKKSIKNLNKSWAEVQKKYDQKSRDHQSFDIKNQDKKSRKGLKSKIDASKANEKDDDRK